VTDKEALKEIARQEKRFAAANCGRGRLLAKSAREYYDAIIACHRKAVAAGVKSAAAQKSIAAITAASDKMEKQARQMLEAVARNRAEIAKLRKVVRVGEMAKNQEHQARLRFEEKVARLGTMPIE